MRVGIIGMGAIGQRVASLVRESQHDLRLCALLVKPGASKDVARFGEDCGVCTDLDDFIARAPNIAVECASTQAFTDHGPRLLSAGIDLMPLSLGALCDPATEAEMIQAAQTGPGRLEVPAGALGGLGLIASARHSGLRRAVFRATYPPARWIDMSKSADVDRADFPDGTPFLNGSVREIVGQFPGHLNVAVGAALAGLGLDRTEMEVCSDSNLRQASFTLSIWSASGNATLEIAGRDAPVDADPCDLTAFSLVRLLERRLSPIAC